MITLLVGALAGWLAGLIMRGSGYGILGNIVVGLLGALIGSLLFNAAKVSLNLGSATVERILIAVVGALLLMLAVSLLRPRSFGDRFARFWRR